ncbi:hypothetical protein H4R19_000089 [Coemansia spiralis]|nr:hypothetical protein H4R19_000089 [Coemansia spiralis]
MAAGDSGDAAGGPSQADAAAHTPPQNHPFFAPIASKLASKRHTPCPGGAPAEKRPRRPKAPARTPGKSTTIQSFFAVRSAVAEPSGLPCPIAAAADLPGADSVAIDAEPSDGTAPASAWGGDGAAAAWRPRPVRRTAKVPAPLPDITHVPAPARTRFVTGGHAGDAGTAGRFARSLHATSAPTALEVYAGDEEHAPAGDNECQWRALAGEHFSRQQQPRLRALSLSDTGSAAAQPVCISFGGGLPRAPLHLQFLEPLLERLRGTVPCDERADANLLAVRHRPRRVRDLLGNRRATGQLQSWIDGMRLRRPAAASADIATVNDTRPATLRARTRPQAQRRRPESGTGNNSSNSSSDDDFMPRQERSRRRCVPDADALDGVMAWAQSSGSLVSVRERLHATPRHRRRGSDGGGGSSSDAEPFANIILLVGPSGSCKTATVYACAIECGFQVHEIHPGQRRSGKDVLAALEDVIQSHTIAIPTGGAQPVDRPTVSQMLVLIEHVDVLFEQDQRLWPALKQLALRSRRPIVLTCNDASCISWDAGKFHSVLQFRRPSEHALVPYCFLLCLSEGAVVSPADLARACREANCDVNRVLSHLDFALRKPPLAQEPDTAATLRTVDLGGTLAWLAGPAEAGETAHTRYAFWLEIVASMQAPDDRRWFGCWPDPPPKPVAAPRLASLTREIKAARDQPLLVNQNTFFAVPSAPPGSLGTGRTTAPATTSPVPQRMATPLRLAPGVFLARDPADHEGWPRQQHQHNHQSSEAGAGTCNGADLALLDMAAAALDTLSLASMAGSQAAAGECLVESLHSQLAPMPDGCLGVSYILLDPQTLARRNPALLPDSVGCSQRTSTRIAGCLRSMAVSRLGTLPGLALFAASIGDSLAPRGIVLPQPPGPASGCGETERHVRDAAAFAGGPALRRGLPGLADSAGYLARMVVLDWLHQGKLAAPQWPVQVSACSDGAEHAYRVGARRTRQQTYRAHIKHLPLPLQEFLVSRIGRR